MNLVSVLVGDGEFITTVGGMDVANRSSYRFRRRKSDDPEVHEALTVAGDALLTLNWGLGRGHIDNMSESALADFNSYSPDLGGSADSDYDTLQVNVFALVEGIDEAMDVYLDGTYDDEGWSDDEWITYYDELLEPFRSDFNEIIDDFTASIQSLGADKGEYGIPKVNIRKSVRNRFSRRRYSRSR